MKSILWLFLFTALLAAGAIQAKSDEPTNYGVIFEEQKEFRHISPEGIDVDQATGEITVALTKADFAEELKLRGEGGGLAFFSGSTATQYNDLLIYSFAQNLALNKLTTEAYSLNGREFHYLRKDIGEKIKTKSLSEIRKSYPAYFRLSGDNTAGRAAPVRFKMQGGPFGFLVKMNSARAGDRSEGGEVVLRSPGEGLMPSHQYCANDASRTVTAYWGKRSNEKYGEQKDLVFATFDYNGRMLNSFEIHLPFPRNLSGSFPVRSKTDPAKVVGKAFVFERMLMFGKKYNDPERNNFDLVICDNAGKLLVCKTFKVGDANGTFLIPYYAVEENNKIWLLAQVGGRQSGLVITTVTYDGALDSKIIARKDITPRQLYENNERPSPREEFEGRGLTFGPGGKFAGMGHVVAANGDLLIWGRSVGEVIDPDYKPKDPQVVEFPPKVSSYRDFVCFQFNRVDELVALYSAKLMSNSDATPISTTVADEKIVFCLADAKRPLSEFEKNLLEMPSLVSPDVDPYRYHHLYAPKFVSITITDPRVESQASSRRDFTLFSPQRYSVASPDKSAIYYFGYTLEKGGAPMKLWLEKFNIKTLGDRK